MGSETGDQQSQLAAFHAGHEGGQQVQPQSQYTSQYTDQHQQFHPAVPGPSTSSSSSGGGYPIYRDPAGQLHIALSSDAGTPELGTYSQGPGLLQSTRRPSVSHQIRRIKNARNHPYTLRAPSNSVSSVASNSSTHSHSSNNNNTTTTPGVYFPASASSNTSYTDLGVQPNDNSNVSDPRDSNDAVAWNNAASAYVHSRSSSISSVSSDISSSSQTSSGWSDISHSHDISTSTTSYGQSSSSTGPYKNQNGNNLPNAYYTPVSYNSSPAIQFSDNSYGNNGDGTTSLACLDGGLIQQQHHYQQHHDRINQLNQAHFRNSHSSTPQTLFPVVLQPPYSTSSSSTKQQNTFMSSPSNDMLANQGLPGNFAFPSASASDGGYGLGLGEHSSASDDSSLDNLAEAIRKSAGSTTTTEKARINFVHGWLKRSFILHPEGNISRHALYNTYIHICHQYNLAPINAASYGKAVRSCWPGIKTRRLGVRGASRYHYCGIRASIENIKILVDHYSAFERGTGKAVVCQFFSNNNTSLKGYNNGKNGSQEGISDMKDEDDNEEEGRDERDDHASFIQDGLAAHLGGLNGLGGRCGDNNNFDSMGSAKHDDNNNSRLSSIALLPPSMFNAKIERPGTAFSSSSTTAIDDRLPQLYRPPSSTSSYSDVQVPFFSKNEDSGAEDGNGDPPLIGPFSFGNSSNQLRKQGSIPTSLNEQMMLQRQSQQNELLNQQQQQSQESLEIAFADMKTPTAFQFLQNHSNSNPAIVNASGSSNTSTNSSGPPNNSMLSDRLAVPALPGYTPLSQFSSPLVGNASGAGLDQQGQGNDSSSTTCLLGRTPSPAIGMTRSASIPGTSSSTTSTSTSDTFAQRFKSRRATVPDLHITIPPLSRNPPSSSSSTTSVSVRQRENAGAAIKEEGDEMMSENEEDENDDDDEDRMYEGKKTARLIPRSGDFQQGVSSSSMPVMLDLPLPSFGDIIHNFSARLVTANSPNHSSSHPSPSVAAAGGAGVGTINDTTLSADAVIAARNRSLALLKDLDMAHAEAVWDLYRTSHCRGLLRLAQQGKLEEFEGAFLLFWAQLDSTQQTLVQHPVLSDAMYQADALLYPFLLTQLSERLLYPSSHAASHQNQHQHAVERSVPVDLVQLGHIAKNLEEWAVAAFGSYPKEFAECRIELASRAAHLLARLAGVVQLAQALSGILKQPGSAETLLSAWQNLDFEMITNQCALVTGCSQEVIQSYFDQFQDVLKNVRDNLLSSTTSTGNSDTIATLLQHGDMTLERYVTTLAEASARLSGVIEDKNGTKAGDAFAASALKMDERPFLIKWSYISSQILRELIISSSPAFGSYQIMSLFIEEYLAFKILKNYTLRSDNVAASIQADNDNAAGNQLGVLAYYISTGTGSLMMSNAVHAHVNGGPANQDVAMGAFLISPRAHTYGASTISTSSAVHEQMNQVDGSATSSGADHKRGMSASSACANETGFFFPFGQPSANAYTTSFNLSSTSSTWSPATRYLFGELSLPSSTSLTFPARSGVSSGYTPEQMSFTQSSKSDSTAQQRQVSPNSTSSSASTEQNLAMLPPPTPSAFSSFPNLRSPGLSRYFPSGSRSATSTAMQS